MSASPSTEDFLAVASDFQLGMLDTERPHPKTIHLADWARNELPTAISALRAVDRDALQILEGRLGQLAPLRSTIRTVIDRGDRIFLCGCGATGRLSIALEILARQGLLRGATAENVIGFMAGGDAALIRAIERFEDHPEYAERQLVELGFRKGDLLIASTEGGETPFVIGATETAAAAGGEPPFFLYCNPDDLLREHVARSRRVLDNEDIRKINLAVGPMALSGSTRMQASTVLMAAIGFSMGSAELERAFESWKTWAVDQLDWSFLAPFIEAEASAYQSGDQVIYEPGPFRISVLTDTTERSPTFALPAFERAASQEPASLCYLHVPDSDSASQAWKNLLQRAPRPLEWGTLQHLTGAEAIARFDFSSGAPERRRSATGRPQRIFRIDRVKGSIRWQFGNLEHHIPVPEGITPLGENLLLKMLLNAHSTLVMGRLGRYEDNLMTYVAANNFKLIDRAIRYTLLLLKRHHGLEPSYDTVARTLLNERAGVAPGEPIVLRTLATVLRLHAP
ncbi:MAG: N-acetylmuramic acid 6-phosphate etherase [Verrucomicrobia bacterium]|nr:MAG: N-acetylmuramic acid 6-phosphate etherase [Verrucomicrobiota bacterium]